MANNTASTDAVGVIKHDKFAILHGTTLIGGSYNWTDGAPERNYDGLLILREPAATAAYETEFQRLWTHAAGKPQPADSPFSDDGR